MELDKKEVTFINAMEKLLDLLSLSIELNQVDLFRRSSEIPNIKRK